MTGDERASTARESSRRARVGDDVPEPVAPGQLRRKHLLETDATYRVIELQNDHVVVEVVDAPGLEPGQRFRFLRSAVEHMALIRLDSSDDEPSAKAR